MYASEPLGFDLDDTVYALDATTIDLCLSSVYVLVAILKKRLALEASLHEILQVLSLNLFEKVPILQALGRVRSQEKSDVILII